MCRVFEATALRPEGPLRRQSLDVAEDVQPDDERIGDNEEERDERRDKRRRRPPSAVDDEIDDGRPERGAGDAKRRRLEQRIGDRVKRSALFILSDLDLALGEFRPGRIQGSGRKEDDEGEKHRCDEADDSPLAVILAHRPEGQQRAAGDQDGDDHEV